MQWDIFQTTPVGIMVKRITLYIAAFFSVYALSLVGFYLSFNDNLPDIAAWTFQPKRITKVYSEDGQHLKDFLERESRNPDLRGNSTIHARRPHFY